MGPHSLVYGFPLPGRGRILNGHAAISPEVAICLEKAGWSSADYWLSCLTACDLAQARRGEDSIRVERY